MRYKLGCSLGYEINSPTTFIFNVEVAHLKSLAVLSETMTLSPGLKREVYVTPDLKNRYLGVNTQAGPFSLEYNAEVDLTVHRADPASINETPISALPIDILPFLLPSRFVSSDRLTPFAQAEFGHLPKGHQRVNAICATGSTTTSPTSAAPATARPPRTRACSSAPACAVISRISAPPSAGRSASRPAS